MFTVGIEVHEGIGTVTLKGELDHQTADRLRRVVLTALCDGAASLVIDCDQLAFVDSTGLSVLVEAHKAADSQAGAITIRHASPLVLRLLDVTGLSAVLNIEPGTARKEEVSVGDGAGRAEIGVVGAAATGQFSFVSPPASRG